MNKNEYGKKKLTDGKEERQNELRKEMNVEAGIEPGHTDLGATDTELQENSSRR